MCEGLFQPFLQVIGLCLFVWDLVVGLAFFQYKHFVYRFSIKIQLFVQKPRVSLFLPALTKLYTKSIQVAIYSVTSWLPAMEPSFREL